MTLSDPPFDGNPGNFARFGYPGYYIGTSMAAPEVSAAAALVIAGRVLGPRPDAGAGPAAARADRDAVAGRRDHARLRYGYGLSTPARRPRRRRRRRASPATG